MQVRHKQKMVLLNCQVAEEDSITFQVVPDGRIKLWADESDGSVYLELSFEELEQAVRELKEMQ